MLYTKMSSLGVEESDQNQIEDFYHLFSASNGFVHPVSLVKFRSAVSAWRQTYYGREPLEKGNENNLFVGVWRAVHTKL